jgi:hypothetical protein
MRLTNATAAAWVNTTHYVVGSVAIGSDGRKYTSKTGTTETPNENNNPVVTPAATTTDWTLEPEINPSPMAVQGDTETPTASDLREFVPWFEVGDIVELIKIGSAYYIPGLLRVKFDGSLQSIAYNPAQHRIMGVFA